MKEVASLAVVIVLVIALALMKHSSWLPLPGATSNDNRVKICHNPSLFFTGSPASSTHLFSHPGVVESEGSSAGTQKKKPKIEKIVFSAASRRDSPNKK